MCVMAQDVRRGSWRGIPSVPISFQVAKQLLRLRFLPLSPTPSAFQALAARPQLGPFWMGMGSPNSHASSLPALVV